MKRTLSVTAITGMLLAGGAQAQTVTLPAGSVQGITEAGVTAFKGIPFAAAPVGDNRWRAPQPAPHWQGLRDASKFGADCAQPVTSFGASGNPAGMSEDCLFLNVWRPAGIAPSHKLPVMVWIYGGAFLFGSGALASTSGEQFARQGVILVSLNYRVGRFGFFAFPALNQEHPDETKANFAFMDQIAALKWVQDNIAALGGDPGNVTIFGESAGGVSVHTLLASPLARGLFHKAIIESGGGRDGTLTARPMQADNADVNYPVSGETIGINFARRYGIAGSDAAALAKLRALSTDQLIDGGQGTAGPGGPQTYPGPILDGRLIVETAQSAYDADRQAPVPIMIGSNSAEVPGGFLAATNKAELFDSFGKGKSAAMAAYDPAGTGDFAKLLTQVTTDRVWAEPARYTARSFTRLGQAAYIYRFSYVADSMKGRWSAGAPHASEINFVFDTVKTQYGAALTQRDAGVARMMNAYWANFARTGNPNGKDLPQWPQYSVAGNEVLDILGDGTTQAGPDANRVRIEATELSGGTVSPR